MRYLSVACMLLLCICSCRKNSGTGTSPALDSPIYSFFPGSTGTNDLSMIFTADGNIALAGTSASGDILLLKLSQTGNQLLRKELPPAITGPLAYSAMSIYSLVQTNDGGYMMCGSGNVAGATNVDVLLLKMNSAGDLVWAKTYGGIKNDYGQMMIRTKDGGYLVCGISYSFTTEAYDDIYLVKVNADGNAIWAQSYARHEQQTPFHLLETTNGDYVVTGTDEPTGNGRVAYLLRIDADGHKLWDNSNGLPNSSRWAYCSAEAANGNIMTTGEAGGKVLLMSTNSAGATVWEQTYAIADSVYSRGVSIKIKSSSCMITGGSTGPSNTSAKCFLLKTDMHGNKLFTKIFSGTGTMNAVNLLVNNSGDNIISGYQFIDINNKNIFLTRTDANGNYK